LLKHLKGTLEREQQESSFIDSQPSAFVDGKESINHVCIGRTHDHGLCGRCRYLCLGLCNGCHRLHRSGQRAGQRRIVIDIAHPLLPRNGTGTSCCSVSAQRSVIGRSCVHHEAVQCGAGLHSHKVTSCHIDQYEVK